MKRSCRATEHLRHRWPVLGIIVGLLGLVTLGNSCAYAQSEIDPDHFDLSNTEPFPQQEKGPASLVQPVRYQGNFSLPYTVRCRGTKLSPGKYSISFSSNGTAAQFTLMRKGHIVEAGAMQHAEGRSQGRDALILRCRGKMRRLSAIHVAGSDFVFAGGLGAEPVSGNRPDGIEILPLMVQKN
jgi:hypothetical protein